MSFQLSEVGNFHFEPQISYQGPNPFSVSLSDATTNAALASEMWPRTTEVQRGSSHPETKTRNSVCFGKGKARDLHDEASGKS